MLFLCALFGLVVAILRLSVGLLLGSDLLSGLFSAAMTGGLFSLLLGRWIHWVSGLRSPESQEVQQPDNSKLDSVSA